MHTSGLLVGDESAECRFLLKIEALKPLRRAVAEYSGRYSRNMSNRCSRSGGGRQRGKWLYWRARLLR